ncbi:amidohydrolase family protein [Porifericola rhodea]|uniref:amidohydrolase family protein n=1 Tax=Porifericola rhodea TaxID=930972 RepID=UPI002665F42D|nr:amidohydrolase family protein [Porifericola rhodea]WKN33752.1 amidohydrolase family protein [Porifericola rhodea]
MLYYSSLLLLLVFTFSPFAYAQSPDTTNNPNSLLLKDYRPESIYKGAQTEVNKAKFPVIDMHTHPYVKSEVELDAWVKTMDELNIDKSVILTYQSGEAFDSLYRFFQKYPDRFILFCGFDYTDYDKPGFSEKAVKELERCYKSGARGVGELGDKGKGLFYSRPTRAYGMHIDDARMAPLLKKCAELNMPVSVHVADPIWMYQPMNAKNDGLMNAYRWRIKDQENAVSHTGMLNILENAVKAHPSTTFIACHFANTSYDLSLLGDLFDKYPNLYADISARFAETAAIPRTAARFYTKYANRLVYGSDMGTDKKMYKTTFRILESEDEHFYDHSISSYHWAMHGFGLSEEVLKQVYQANAQMLLKK